MGIRSSKPNSLPLENSAVVLSPGRVIVPAVPPVAEPKWGLQVVLVVPHNCDVLHEDVAMSQRDADDIGEEVGAEEHHHDGVDEGEVARCVEIHLLFTLKPNIRVISSWGNRLHQM